MATPPSFHEMHTNIKPRILGSAHCFEHKQMAQEGREMRKVHQIVDGFFFSFGSIRSKWKLIYMISVDLYRIPQNSAHCWSHFLPAIILISSINIVFLMLRWSVISSGRGKFCFFIIANSFPSYEFAQGKTNKFHSIAVENVQQWMRVVRWIRCNIKTETVDTLRANYWSTSSFCDC